MSDLGGQGIFNFGQALQNFGQTLGRAIQGTSQQEMIRAKQYFNRRYNEWAAENADTRWDNIEDSYEEFVNGFREEMTASGNEFFSTDRATTDFSFWFEEAQSGRKVPISQSAAQARQQYEQQLFENNVAGAVDLRDPNLLAETVLSRVDNGDILPEQGRQILKDGMYQMNLAQTKDEIMSFARENGFEAAFAQLDDYFEGRQVEYQIGTDSQGQPIIDFLSSEDIDKIEDEVRQELTEERKEQQYQVEWTDTQYDEQANQIFNDNSLDNMLGFKDWLQTDEVRQGMTSNTWLKWNRLVDGLIGQEEGEVNEAARTQFIVDHMRNTELGADPTQQTESILQGVEQGLIDEGDARSLISFDNTNNDTSLVTGVQNYIEGLAEEYDLNPAEAATVNNAFIRWFRSDIIQVGPDGDSALNPRNASEEDVRRIAENLFFANASDRVQRKNRAAYQIRSGDITPQQDRGLSRIGAALGIGGDNAERLLESIQNGEFLGWQQMPRAVEQLNTLWSAQAELLKESTQVEPTNAITLQNDGTPLFQVTDNTQQTRYLRYFLEDGDEQLQVWEPDTQTWRTATVTRTSSGFAQIGFSDDEGGAFAQ